MKIVYKKTILDKLNELIDSAQGDIDYIAVSRDEMVNIITEVSKDDIKSKNITGSLLSLWVDRFNVKSILYQSNIILRVEE